MIHEIGTEIQAAIQARGCPFFVVDGPEREKAATWGRERIVIERDPAGDSFSPMKGSHRNPRRYIIRNIGCKITIYAQEPAAGALEFEHYRRAEHVLDFVLVALDDVATVRNNGFDYKGGKWLAPDDLAKSETFGGAVYELSFTFERGVRAETWEGAARPTVAGSMRNTTKVSLKGGADDDNDPNTVPASAETSCGN